MKVGDKVFVVTGWDQSSTIHIAGTIFNIDKSGYAKIMDSGTGKIHGPYLLGGYAVLDTPHNRIVWSTHVDDMKAWKAKEPNVYAAMNALQK